MKYTWVKRNLNELYDTYTIIYSNGPIQYQSAPQIEFENEDDSSKFDVNPLFTSGFMRLLKETNEKECKIEVDWYVMESCEDFNNPDVDISA